MLSIETANIGFLNSNVPVKLFLHCIVDSKIDENEQETKTDQLLAVLNFTASEFFRTLSVSFKHSSQLLEVSMRNIMLMPYVVFMLELQDHQLPILLSVMIVFDFLNSGLFCFQMEISTS